MANPSEKSVSTNALHEQVVQSLLEAISLRDMETVGHHMRVADLAFQLGKAMHLTNQQLIDLRYGAILHDVGKLGVPDSILFKPGALTEHEYNLVKRHATMGANILRHIQFLQGALVVAESHHERWDGDGYPLGLKGEEIPLLARVVAVAGTYDALTSTRFYRPAWTREVTLQYLEEQSGKAFDPKIVEVFLRLMQT